MQVDSDFLTHYKSITFAFKDLRCPFERFVSLNKICSKTCHSVVRKLPCVSVSLWAFEIRHSLAPPPPPPKVAPLLPSIQVCQCAH